MTQALRIDVLVVDDEAPVAELLVEVLRDEELSAIAVSDGREVLAAVREYRPRLLLLDVMLPGLTGLEVIDQLARELVQPPPVILMSAAGSPARRPANVPFVAKPFDIDALLDVVYRTLASG